MFKHIAAILAAFAVSTPQLTQATAISTSELLFSNLKLLPQSGSVDLLEFWELEAFSEARNSRGDLARSFADNFLGGLEVEQGDADASFTEDLLAVSATASVLWAEANGAAEASSAFPPDFDISGTVSTDVRVPEDDLNWVFAQAGVGFLHEFIVTGGTGLVSVEFSVDLLGENMVSTDLGGSAALVDQFFVLEIFDPLPGGETPQDQIVLFYENFLECAGIDCIESGLVDETITASRVVEYDTRYVFGILLSDVQIAGVPEPSSILLIGLGVIGIGFARGKKITQCRTQSW